MAEEILLVLSTWPDAGQARAAAGTLIDERLAACANILPQAQSIYRWKGAVETADELLVVFKTTRACYARFAARLQALHSYEVPEILAFTAADGLPDYLSWVKECCTDDQ